MYVQFNGYSIIGSIGLIIKISLLHLLKMTRGKIWRWEPGFLSGFLTNDFSDLSPFVILDENELNP